MQSARRFLQEDRSQNQDEHRRKGVQHAGFGRSGMLKSVRLKQEKAERVHGCEQQQPVQRSASHVQSDLAEQGRQRQNGERHGKSPGQDVHWGGGFQRDFDEQEREPDDDGAMRDFADCIGTVASSVQLSRKHEEDGRREEICANPCRYGAQNRERSLPRGATGTFRPGGGATVRGKSRHHREGLCRTGDAARHLFHPPRAATTSSIRPAAELAARSMA